MNRLQFQGLTPTPTLKSNDKKSPFTSKSTCTGLLYHSNLMITPRTPKRSRISKAERLRMKKKLSRQNTIVIGIDFHGIKS
jgi:hypothetical protein